MEGKCDNNPIVEQQRAKSSNAMTMGKAMMTVNAMAIGNAMKIMTAGEKGDVNDMEEAGTTTCEQCGGSNGTDDMEKNGNLKLF